MPQKPRSRKRRGRKGTYAAVAVVVIAAVVAVSYYYIYVLPATPLACSTTTDLVYANINTTKGPIEVELFPSCAPKTVANFVSLAKSGFYNNLVWHRIVDNPPFVIQTGDPLTRNGRGSRSLWGTGGSNQTVPLEINPSLLNDVGYLGMARGPTNPNSGTSQFYINLANNTSLNGQYTVFGKVISGMNAVDEIASTPVNSNDQPITPVYVISITILSSGP